VGFDGQAVPLESKNTEESKITRGGECGYARMDTEGRLEQSSVGFDGQAGPHEGKRMEKWRITRGGECGCARMDTEGRLEQSSVGFDGQAGPHEGKRMEEWRITAGARRGQPGGHERPSCAELGKGRRADDSRTVEGE